VAAADYEALLLGQNRRPPAQEFGESDPAQIIYTSGTTGRPKGAVITHGNLVWNFFNTVMAREDQPGHTLLIIGPLFHAGPLNNQMSIHVGLGGTCVLMPKFEPEEALRAIERERVTALVAVPAAYNMMIHHPKADQYDVSSMIHLWSGADKLPMETKRDIREFFQGIQGVGNIYGCSEATATITALRARESDQKSDSVGPCVPFLQMAVVDDQDRPLPAGEIGEVVSKGPTVMKEYYRNPEATEETLRGGWLHTGDMGYTDEEGYLYIADRKKDMVLSGGENIYPREVEEVLFTHPEILDAAVIGVPDPLWGEQVKACVVRKPGSSLDAEAVIEYCKPRLAGYKKPKIVEFIDEIPRGGSGKALKNLLRQRGTGGTS
jgi:acyl-CoA synthetase (AMP-forming)/AMP-acid ligase II